MEPKHILIADDDPNIRKMLVGMLENADYRVTTAEDGMEAFEIFRKAIDSFDLVVLDLIMPGMSGYDVCRSIRLNNPNVPIIMLTGKDEEIDKVLGLELGADDYVTKPFAIREFLARVAAALRRGELAPTIKQPDIEEPTENLPEKFAIGNATIDFNQYLITVGRKTRKLTVLDMKLLGLFYKNPNRILNREFLLKKAWGPNYEGTTRTLDQHIAQLRKKIAEEKESCPILTIHGVGYKYQQR